MFIGRYVAALTTGLIILWAYATSQQLPRAKRKKNVQITMNRLDVYADAGVQSKIESGDINGALNDKNRFPNKEVLATQSIPSENEDPQCPHCGAENPEAAMSLSLQSFWNNDLYLSYQ